MPLQIPPELKENINDVVSAVGSENVEVYRFLRQRFRETLPRDDFLFQFVFRSFYRLDSAGLTDEFKERYFELLSVAKSERRAELAVIVRSLHELPNRKGQRSLQFSFASKLVATVNDDAPIYDAEIAAVFGFSAPPSSKPFEQRLETYLAFYADLIKLYRSVIEHNRLAAARQLFRAVYRVPSSDDMPDSKVLDFIFWSAGKQSRASQGNTEPDPAM